MWFLCGCSDCTVICLVRPLYHQWRCQSDHQWIWTHGVPPYKYWVMLRWRRKYEIRIATQGRAAHAILTMQLNIAYLATAIVCECKIVAVATVYREYFGWENFGEPYRWKLLVRKNFANELRSVHTRNTFSAYLWILARKFWPIAHDFPILPLFPAKYFLSTDYGISSLSVLNNFIMW